LKLPMPAGQSAPHQDGGLALAHSPVYPPGSSALYGGATMLTGMYGAFPSPTPYSAVPVVASGPGLDSPQPPPSTSVSSSHGGRPLASEGGSPPTTVPIAVPQTYHFPPEYAAYAYSYAPTTATYAYGLGYAPTAAPGHFAVTSLAHGMSKPRTGSLEGGEPSSRGTYAHHQVSVAYSMIGPHYRDGGVDPTASTVGPKQSQGPPGANLFVYHLPPQLRDGDLRELFRTFGNILSAKVYTDRRTEESKGFGEWCFVASGYSLSQTLPGKDGVRLHRRLCELRQPVEC
jgi:RNA recognition motif. (a.k.a. RRM, RBD, or RNP domain)